MTEVTVERRAGKVVGFGVRGHAWYAAAGQDTVCAAVSTLAQAAVIGLSDYLGLRVEVCQKKGYLKCRLPVGAEDDPRVQAILETMVLGLKGVAAAHGEYVRVSERGES